MTFKAFVNIMPHPELLDPQGKAVAGSMKHLDLAAISDVRIGKRIELVLEASSSDEASRMVENACTKLLANPIMEHFHFHVEALAPQPV